MSECGRYAIRRDTSDPRNTKFDALRIPGVWASPERIRACKTEAQAEQVCREDTIPKTTTANLAKGL